MTKKSLADFTAKRVSIASSKELGQHPGHVMFKTVVLFSHPRSKTQKDCNKPPSTEQCFGLEVPSGVEITLFTRSH